ncbi:hypothetical protein D9757_012061 [Collybiopsis confluens]|uniref:GmrSD restriction endonucleases N-terminal domain-containing protein n=1 Tax=Collybiopsis confluens TaxID=2823264 RepID=A0A8H5D1N8_9AGAR|nr:hypothetical protein D9757_012061 [Collybiopsis confluens]
MYEDEELSELSEEDELAFENGNGATTSSYHLQKALKPPRATTYTAQALFDQIRSSDIDLDPEYQRDVVWTKEKQTNLIDSILRNFYIPPIIFAVRIFEDGTETRTCIDGKQRLTSIHRFMEGVIPHRDPITGQKLWFKIDRSESSSAAKRELLPDKYRTMFSNKQVVCVEYSDLTDGDERDIFQRVQLGMALTSAEKLHVINTPRARFIRDLLSEFVSEDTLGSSSIPWDKSRGSDFRCVSQAVYLMDRWNSQLKNAGSLAQVEKWLNAGTDDKKTSKSARNDDADYGKAEVPVAFQKKVKDAYSLLVSPVEMICFPVLVYAHGVLPFNDNKMSPEELSQAISDMRDDVREQHKDIRMNDRVGKTMIEFIQSIEGNTARPKPAADESVSVPVPTAKAKGKRRRVSEADIGSEDDDYRPRKKSSSRRSKGQVGVRSKTASTTSSTRADNLAKARAAKAEAAAVRKARINLPPPSPPNPQQLPSPGPAEPVVKTEPGASNGSQNASTPFAAESGAAATGADADASPTIADDPGTTAVVAAGADGGSSSDVFSEPVHDANWYAWYGNGRSQPSVVLVNVFLG